MRVGQGYDSHAFVPGRKLILGGVVVPHDQGLAGHSDADVLTHALIDALLGSMALGDLGTHFPPGDPKFKDADSLQLLQHAVGLLENKGVRVMQVDCTLVIERPRVATYVPAMRENLACTLSLALEQVSVKATTNDGMGWIGRGEGAAATAVVTVQTSEESS